MARAFIDDGYTIDDTVPAHPGHHPEVKFSYRPATYREIRAIDKAIAEPATVDEAVNATCEFVAKHVVAWDIRNSQGQAVPITADNVDRLDSVLAAQLFNRTRGLFPDGVTPPVEATDKAPGNC